MRARTAEFAAFDTMLRRQGAAMEAWQVAALVLGALTSTNIRLGPQHLLPLILGDAHEGFASIEEAQALLGALMTLWNDRARTIGEEGGATLSSIPLAAAPSREELRIYAARRAEELRCFVCGLDAGGDHPAEFGEEGKELFRVGQAVRAEALAAFEERSGRGRSDDGVRAGKVGRNMPCPCGSGQKYKRCCGAVPTSH